MSKYPGAEGETLHICHGGRVPELGTWAGLSLTPHPPPPRKCTVSSARRSSLTFCLSLTRMSSRLLLLPLLHSAPAPLPLPSLHPAALFRRGWGGGEEVTFINGEFMCMTASKPELCLDRPWRLSINSSNHQSAKYFPFRAHQLCTRWPAVIYRMGRVRRSAHLHRYRYGGTAAPGAGDNFGVKSSRRTATP